MVDIAISQEPTVTTQVSATVVVMAGRSTVVSAGESVLVATTSNGSPEATHPCQTTTTVRAALFPFVRMATMMSSAAGPVPPMARGITGVIVAAEATKATAPALRRVTAILLSHRPLGQFQTRHLFTELLTAARKPDSEHVDPTVHRCGINREDAQAPAPAADPDFSFDLPSQGADVLLREQMDWHGEPCL